MNFFFTSAFWGILLIIWGISLVLKAIFPSFRFPLGTIFISICIIIFGIQLLVNGFSHRRSNSHIRVKSGISEYQSSSFTEELNVVFTSDSINLHDIDVSSNDRYVEVNSVFGRAIVYVTENTPVRLESNAVFGKIYKDSRIKYASGDENALIIEAVAVFGSVDIIVVSK